MAKLFLKNAYEFENPSRRVFMAGELFEGAASQQAKKTRDYFKDGESTPEAIKLAQDVAKQAEEIRKGTNKELLDLYVDLFHSFKIPDQASISSKLPADKDPDGELVDATYEKKGMLAVAASICPLLGTAYKLYPDLQLLSYATVFNNLKTDAGEGADANFLPKGARVRVENGIVYVTYAKGGIKKTFHSELFPWSSYDVAYEKWIANKTEERASTEEKYQREGRPDDGLDTDDNPAAVQERAPVVRLPDFGEAPLMPDMPSTPPAVAPVIPPKPEEVKAKTDASPEGVPEDLMDAEWAVIETTLLALQTGIHGTSIVVREPSPRNGQLNRTKYSKIIEVSNAKTGSSYNVEVRVPVKDRPKTYNDARVEVSVWEHTPLGSKDNYVKRDLLDSEGRVVEYTGENRIFDTVAAIATILSNKKPTERDRIKKTPEKSLGLSAVETAEYMSTLTLTDPNHPMDQLYRAVNSFQEKYSGFLTNLTDKGLAIEENGRIKQTIDFAAAEGTSVEVDILVRPLDLKAVDALVAAAEAQGKTVNRQQIIQYLSTKQAVLQLSAGLSAQEAELAQRYAAYKARTAPTAAPQEVAPKLPYTAEVSSGAQVIMDLWGFTMKDVNWRSKGGEKIVHDLASVEFTALADKLTAGGQRKDGSLVHYEGKTAEEFMANVEYNEIQDYLKKNLSEKDRAKMVARSQELLETYPNFVQ